MPTLPLIVVHQEHVVGEDLPEGKRLVRGRLLRVCRFGDGDLGQGGLLDVGWLTIGYIGRQCTVVAPDGRRNGPGRLALVSCAVRHHRMLSKQRVDITSAAPETTLLSRNV